MQTHPSCMPDDLDRGADSPLRGLARTVADYICPHDRQLHRADMDALRRKWNANLLTGFAVDLTVHAELNSN